MIIICRLYFKAFVISVLLISLYLELLTRRLSPDYTVRPRQQACKQAKKQASNKSMKQSGQLINKQTNGQKLNANKHSIMQTINQTNKYKKQASYGSKQSIRAHWNIFRQLGHGSVLPPFTLKSVRPSRPNKFTNLTKEELLALKSLRSREDIVTKRADKGGAVVVWRADVYRQEALRQPFTPG